MRKEIIGLIISAGLVYAQAVVAKDVNRNDQGTAALSQSKSSKQIAKRNNSKQYANKNYYKKTKGKAQSGREDEYTQTEHGYSPRSTHTSYDANHELLNRVETDLPMNTIGRDHR
ncbi:MAG: hypothetical protein JSR17_05740 [Proteobacteria bacterium]|nr:hypothetical protein [Pseudomonadota bacterium]